MHVVVIVVWIWVCTAMWPIHLLLVVVVVGVGVIELQSLECEEFEIAHNRMNKCVFVCLFQFELSLHFVCL